MRICGATPAGSGAYAGERSGDGIGAEQPGRHDETAAHQAIDADRAQPERGDEEREADDQRRLRMSVVFAPMPFSLDVHRDVVAAGDSRGFLACLVGRGLRDLGRAHGETGEQPLEIAAVARRTFRRVVVADERLELAAAGLAVKIV